MANLIEFLDLWTHLVAGFVLRKYPKKGLTQRLRTKSAMRRTLIIAPSPARKMYRTDIVKIGTLTSSSGGLLSDESDSSVMRLLA